MDNKDKRLTSMQLERMVGDWTRSILQANRHTDALIIGMLEALIADQTTPVILDKLADILEVSVSGVSTHEVYRDTAKVLRRSADAIRKEFA